MPPRDLTDAARDLIRRHVWRGNIRELENTMHRAVLLAQGAVIEPGAVILTGSIAPDSDTANGTTAPAGGLAPATVSGPNSATRPLVGRTVADVERDLIIDTLRHCVGNRTHAANILGISIRTLRNKLKLYTEDGLNVPMPGAYSRSGSYA